MKLRRLLLLLLWPALACAQLDLFVVAGGVETQVTSLYRLPSVYPGDVRDTLFRVRNRGAATVSVTQLKVEGYRFSLPDPPALPFALAPGAVADFTVRFAPVAGGDYSAGLTVNNLTVLLLVNAGNSVTVSLDSGGSRAELQTGQLISFGTTTLGVPVVRELWLNNPNQIRMTLQEVSLTEPHFRFETPPALPLVLDPGQEVRLRLVFDPRTTGEKNGVFRIAERGFPVRGIAVEAAGKESLLVEENGVLRTLLPGEQVDFGQVYLTRSATRRFVISNLTSESITIQTLALAGSSYAFESVPPLPIQLAAGSQVHFYVVFTPGAAGLMPGQLRVGGRTVELKGQGVQAKEMLAVREGGVLRELTQGALVDFGSTYVSTVVAREFVVTNPAAIPVTVAALALDAPAFRLQDSGPVPFTLAPGEQRTFQVEFAPAVSGLRNGTLQVGATVVQVRGTGLEAPLPKPFLSFDKTAFSSAQQGRVYIALESPVSVATTGQLYLEFVPANPSHSADPGVMFLSGASKSIPVSFAAGGVEGLFQGRNYVEFQTGTTAGVLRFSFKLGGHSVEANITVAAAPPFVDSFLGRKNAASIELRLIGFDNTRSVSALRFTFYGPQSSQLGAPVVVDVAEQFRNFFATSGAGGLFSLQAIFPVSGDISQIVGVEAEMTSSAGTARTMRISF